MRIRPIRLDDAEDVHALRLDDGVRATISAMPSDRVADVRARIAAYSTDDHVLVAEVDGRVVARAGLHVRGGRQRHVGWIGVEVAREHQRKGIGRALVERLLEIAERDLGLLRVELDVMADHARAIKLYESLGFAREGVRRAAILRDGEPVDLVVMGRLNPRPPSRPAGT